ncbi:MAG TPA: hypothetical protein VLT33_19750 [Labilithrix sp.]|nr:hypothetical protein [Labilithrix sp.]
MRASKGLIGVALVLVVGCGEAAVSPPAAPSAPGPAASSPPGPAPAKPGPAADPFAVPAGPRDELTKAGPVPLRLDAWDSAIKAKGVAAPLPECAAFAKRAAAAPPPADLVAALSTKDGKQVDAMLLALEPKLDAREPGLVRALRADLAPPHCADVLVDPYLTAHRTIVSRASHVLVGLSLAAKLDRTGKGPPAMGAIKDKEKVKAFINGPLKTWMVEQATAIETLASGGAGLAGYGRGLAALSAGNAEMRLVESIRSAPVPPTWDPELKAIYQASLDEALEPRKKRGRDAALVGLGDLAQAGSLESARTAAAFGLLTSLYGGRRILELAELLVPRPADPVPATPLQIAIGAVAPYWVDVLDLRGEGDADAAVALTHGVPLSLRAAFASAPPDTKPETRAAYARARFHMGQLAWRRVDFVEAAHAAKQGSTPEDRLLLALSLALAQGPNGAAEMMRAPSASALELRHTEALDALVAEGGPLAGWAAFDAAHLRSLSPPEGSEAGPYFRDVAARFRKAESLLADPGKKKLAGKRADEADAIVATLDQKPPKP